MADEILFENKNRNISDDEGGEEESNELEDLVAEYPHQSKGPKVSLGTATRFGMLLFCKIFCSSKPKVGLGLFCFSKRGVKEKEMRKINISWNT